MPGNSSGQVPFSDRNGAGSRSSLASEGDEKENVICCLPLEEVCNGVEIAQRDLNKAVHMICTSQTCDQSGFFHGDCFDKYESYLCKLVADHPQVKKWSNDKSDKAYGFLKKSMWTKVGNHLVRKFCRCKCGCGYLHHDPDWPPVNWNRKTNKKKIFGKPNKVATLPKLNNPKNKITFVPAFANPSNSHRPKEPIGKNTNHDSEARNQDIPGAIWARDSDFRPSQGVVVKWTYQPTGGFGQIKTVDEFGSNKWVFAPSESFLNRSSCDFTKMIGVSVEFTVKKNGKKIQADQVIVLTKEAKAKNKCRGQWKTGVICKWLIDEQAGLIEDNDGKQELLVQKRNINGFVNENELVGKEVRYRVDFGETEAVNVDILQFSSALSDPGPQYRTFGSILDNSKSNNDSNGPAITQLPGTIIYWNQEDGFGYISTPNYQSEVFFNNEALPVGADVSALQDSQVLFTIIMGANTDSPDAFSINKIYPKGGELKLGIISSWNIDDGWGCVSAIFNAEEEEKSLEIVHLTDFRHYVGKGLDLKGTLVDYKCEISFVSDKVAKEVVALVPGPACPLLLEYSNLETTHDDVEDENLVQVSQVEPLEETVVEELGVAGVSVVLFTSRDLSKHPHLVSASSEAGAVELSTAMANMTIVQLEAIYDDLKEFLGCLAAHPTGHLVVQGMLNYFTGKILMEVVENLARDFLNLSRTKLGSTTLITAITSLSPHLVSRLVDCYMEAEDSALLVSCMTDPFGAHVFVSSLPFMQDHVCQTVYLLFIGHFKEIAMHPSGTFPCRRFVEKMKCHAEVLGMIAEEFEADLIEIANCPNGRFVIKSLLEAGSVRVSSMVFQQISGNIAKLVLSPTASTVVDAFIKNAKELQIQLVIEELCSIRAVGSLPCLVEIVEMVTCKSLLSTLLKVQHMYSLQCMAKVLRINREGLKGNEQAAEFMEELEEILEKNKRGDTEERNRLYESSNGARPKVYNY